jgi:hypothetical protein
MSNNNVKVLASAGAGGFRDGPSSIIMEEGDLVDLDSEQRSPGDYYFKFQFFVHECILLKDFFNV